MEEDIIKNKESRGSTKTVILMVAVCLLLGISIFCLVNMQASYNNGYVKGTNDTSFQAGYARGSQEVSNGSYQLGYLQAINDIQNATIVLGYCSAQQELIKVGRQFENGTMIAVPVSYLKPNCFR